MGVSSKLLITYLLLVSHKLDEMSQRSTIRPSCGYEQHEKRTNYV